MSLFESFGETLSGFSKALEALPRVAIEHIHDVEKGPDILGSSVEIQFGSNTQTTTNETEQLATVGEGVVSLADAQSNVDSLELARDRVKEALESPSSPIATDPVDIFFQNNQLLDGPDTLFDEAA